MQTKEDDTRVERGPMINTQLRRTQNLWNEWWAEQHEQRPPTEEDYICFFIRMKRQDKLVFPKDPKLQQQTVRDFMLYLKEDGEDDYHYFGSSSKRLKTMSEEDGALCGTDRLRASNIYDMAQEMSREEFCNQLNLVFGIPNDLPEPVW